MAVLNGMTDPYGSTPWRRYGWVLAVVVLLGAAPLHAQETKHMIGWVERVAIYPGDLVVRAKIDTGAKTASLNCECVQQFKRDGKEWVRFSVINTRGKSISLERRVVRTATIKRHFGGEQHRPVIKLGICLGGVYEETEVNLVDRSGFNYQMLIGRNFLKEGFVVDPARTFLSDPRCADAPGQK